MTRLLIYEPSFRRIEAQLAAYGDRLEPVLANPDGALSFRGAPVEVDAAAPDAVWLNADVFQSPASRAFMIATLKAPALKWVQSAAAGFDHPVFAQLIAKGAKLTTSHGQAIGMAEYVLAGVLDCFQNGPARRAAQARGEWLRPMCREIMGSSWLIVGFGAIGQAVAQRAGAFGAAIVGVRRDLAPHPLAQAIAGMDALPGLLPAADVVVLCLPLGPATRHLADAGFFAAMKAGSVLVNVGRGGLVDESALIAALDRGAPGHAVLDVFETEPLPADNPFWRHPRVSLTAHASGITGGQNRRNETLFLDNLARFLAGAPLLNQVDPKDVLAG